MQILFQLHSNCWATYSLPQTVFESAPLVCSSWGVGAAQSTLLSPFISFEAILNFSSEVRLTCSQACYRFQNTFLHTFTKTGELILRWNARCSYSFTSSTGKILLESVWFRLFWAQAEQLGNLGFIRSSTAEIFPLRLLCSTQQFSEPDTLSPFSSHNETKKTRDVAGIITFPHLCKSQLPIKKLHLVLTLWKIQLAAYLIFQKL